MMPYTYRQLQEWIIERRRQQQSNAGECCSRELVQTAEDLAAKPCLFALDGIVVKHLIEFVLPFEKRANAAEVRPTMAWDAKEKEAVVLSRHTAKAIADDFFEFVQQEHFQQHLALMSAGQILVLCIFHFKLSWLELHDRDQNWKPKPVCTPASAVDASSSLHFVQQLQADAIELSRPQIQLSRKCCLCGEDHAFSDHRSSLLYAVPALQTAAAIAAETAPLPSSEGWD